MPHLPGLWLCRGCYHGNHFSTAKDPAGGACLLHSKGQHHVVAASLVKSVGAAQTATSSRIAARTASPPTHTCVFLPCTQERPRRCQVFGYAELMLLQQSGLNQDLGPSTTSNKLRVAVTHTPSRHWVGDASTHATLTGWRTPHSNSPSLAPTVASRG